MKFKHSKQIFGVLAVLVASGCASTQTAPTPVSAYQSVAVDSIGSAALGDVVSVPAGSGLNASSVVVTSEYMAASRRLCRRMQTQEGQPIARVACKSESGQWSLARDLQPTSTLLMSGAQPPPAQALATRTPSAHASTSQDANEYQSVEIVAVQSDIEPIEVDVNAIVIDENITDETVTLNSDISAQPLGLTTMSQESMSQESMSQESFVAHVVQDNETLWSFAKRTTGNALNWQRIAEINNIDDARTVAGGDVLQVPAELSKSDS